MCPVPGKMIGELLRHAFKKSATTSYPLSKDEVNIPQDLRGKWELYLDKCIGCSLCERVCPSFAIVMVECREGETTKTGKRPICHIDKCVFCAQCEETCPTKAIKLTQNFELALFNRENGVIE